MARKKAIRQFPFRFRPDCFVRVELTAWPSVLLCNSLRCSSWARSFKPFQIARACSWDSITRLSAAGSSFNEYDALLRYLQDGRFEIDNNLVENDIRPTAVGRKRWLFIGHPQAGWCSAVIYSLLLSCRRRGINPQSYLSDVLNRLPSTKITEIHQLLPGHWKPSPPNTS